MGVQNMVSGYSQGERCSYSVDDVTYGHVDKCPTPPLTSFRLEPFRQKIRSLVMTITDDSSVYLEILRTKQDLEIVREVMKISPDGHVIQVYQPQCDNTTVSDSPASPAAGSAREYSHDRLPQKYWKQYQHAARFVELVKSRTSKVTMNTDQAKCMLMENDNCDFEAAFYDGAKVRSSDDVTIITRRDGVSITLETESCSKQLDSKNREIYSYAMKYRQKCLNLVSLMTMGMNGGSRTNATCFPVEIGSRPSARKFNSPLDPRYSALTARVSPPQTELSYLEKTTSPQTSCSTRRSSFSSTSPTNVTPSPTFPPNQRAPPSPSSALPPPYSNYWSRVEPTVLCKVFVPGIGCGTQWSNKEVSVQFVDGSELKLQPSPMVIKYTRPGGLSASFKENDHIPLEVRQKMDTLPAVLHKLRTAQTS